MMDIDHFKSFNDRFGHEAGDTVLKELGRLLQTYSRKDDIACRLGGEEFVLVLPEATFETTRQRAEHLRHRVQALDLQTRGRGLGRITLSLGVALFPNHGTTTEDLLYAADTALYQAKADGRNRVVACTVNPNHDKR
jgi:diguanylate cyclase (GGDEF)-like protein